MAVTRRAILYVDHAPALGGAEQSLLLLLERLDRNEWEPHLACPGGILAEKAAALGVPVHRAALPQLRRSRRFGHDWMATASQLAGIAQRIGATLIHANTVRAVVYASLAAQMAHTPFLWHMRDFWLSENRPDRLLPDGAGKRMLCASARTVIANSQAVACHLPCRSKTVVVYNGIDTQRFSPEESGEAFRHEYSIPEQVPLVGMVGRLRPWKGQQRFLRMAAAVTHMAPDAHFVVVGGDPFLVDDSYALQLRRLVSDLELDARMTFTGHVDDVRPALSAVNVFVHPGDPEPFGLVNLEAMATGKPLVAFAHGALPEIVVHGATGLMAAPGDVAGLAQNVAILLSQPGYAKFLGAAGRRRVVERFDARITADRIQDVYRRIESHD